MSEGRQHVRVQDELTHEFVSGCVLGAAALVYLGILLAERAWTSVGWVLALGTVFSIPLAFGRTRRRALESARLVPFDAVPVRTPVLLLRPVVAALAVGGLSFVDDVGLSCLTTMMWAASSVTALLRLRAAQHPGERFVRPRDWSRAGTIYRMPTSSPPPVATTGSDHGPPRRR